MAVNLSTENKTTLSSGQSKSVASTTGRMQQAHRVANASTTTPTVRHQASPQADPNKLSRSLESISNAVGKVAQDTYSLNLALVDEMVSDDNAMMVHGLDEMDNSLKPGESRDGIMKAASSYRGELIAKKGNFDGNADMQARYREKFVNPSAAKTMAYMKKWQNEENEIRGNQLNEDFKSWETNTMPLMTKGLTGDDLIAARNDVKEEYTRRLNELSRYGIVNKTDKMLQSADSMAQSISAHVKNNFQKLTTIGDTGFLGTDGKINYEVAARIFNDRAYTFAEAKQDPKTGVWSVEPKTDDKAVQEKLSGVWKDMLSTGASMMGTRKKQNMTAYKAMLKASTEENSSKFGHNHNGYTLTDLRYNSEKEFMAAAKKMADSTQTVWDDDAEQVAISAFWTQKLSDPGVTYQNVSSGVGEKTRVAVSENERLNTKYPDDLIKFSFDVESYGKIDPEGRAGGYAAGMTYQQKYMHARKIYKDTGHKWDHIAWASFNDVVGLSQEQDDATPLTYAAQMNSIKVDGGQVIGGIGGQFTTGKYQNKKFPDVQTALADFQVQLGRDGWRMTEQIRSKFINSYFQGQADTGNIKQENVLLLSMLDQFYADNKGEDIDVMGIKAGKGSFRGLTEEEAANKFQSILDERGQGEVLDDRLMSSIVKYHSTLGQKQTKVYDAAQNTESHNASWKRLYDKSSPEAKKKMLEKARFDWWDNFNAIPEGEEGTVDQVAKRNQAIRSFMTGSNTYVTEVITDQMWEEMDNKGVDSHDSYMLWKKYKPFLESDDSLVNLRSHNSKNGDYKYAMLTAFKQHEMSGSKANFSITDDESKMLKLYIQYGGSAGGELDERGNAYQARLFSILNDNDEFQERIEEASKYMSVDDAYKFKRDQEIALIVSGGKDNIVQVAANRQYEEIRTDRGDAKMFVPKDKFMLDLMKGKSDNVTSVKPELFQRNLAIFVAMEIYGNGSDSKSNRYIQVMKSNGLTLRTTSRKGKYEVTFLDSNGYSVSTGRTIDLNNWNGTVPEGTHFGYDEYKSQVKGYNPLGNNAPKKKDWDLSTDKIDEGTR